MKKFLCVVPLVILFCFTIACQDKAAMAELGKFKAQAAVEEQNKALVIRYINAYQKGDIAALKEILSPDYVTHNRGQSGTLENAIESTKQELKVFSDLAFIREDLFAKGDKVVIRYIVSGVHTGDSEGMPATGKKIEIAGVEIERVENGKIVESWEAEDNLSLFEQLGFELKPIEAKKK